MATNSDQMTKLTVELRPEANEKLSRRAAASGQNVAEFVSHLLEHFTEPPTPIEILSGEIGRSFRTSGVTEAELVEELDRAKHEMRADRRTQNPS